MCTVYWLIVFVPVNSEWDSLHVAVPSEVRELRRKEVVWSRLTRSKTKASVVNGRDGEAVVVFIFWKNLEMFFVRKLVGMF